MKDVNGVLVAPAKTQINPIDTAKLKGIPRRPAIVHPKVAPIINKGVTSPPWYPEPKQRAVNKSLSRKANLGACPLKASSSSPVLKLL